jgi:hypothetical protein
MKKLILSTFLFTALFSQAQEKNTNCSKIKTTIDKFDGDTTHMTPLTGVLGTISFMKSKGKIFMNLDVAGYTLNLGEKGVIILLENGGKIEKPEAKIEAEATTNGYKYSAFFMLDETDIELLKNNPITDYRLYIYEGKPTKKNALIYMDFVKCLETM